jgi:hypothetical protein
MPDRADGVGIRRRRLILAFLIAAVSDALSFALALTPPLQWAADAGTAVLLFMVLGWQWVLLPGLIVEAIPGLAVFPFWVLVVGAVAMWGRVRPSANQTLPREKRQTPLEP